MSIESPSRRDVLIGAALLASSAAGWAGSSFNRPRRLPKGRLEALIPPRAGPYHFVGTGGLVVPEERALERDSYDAVLTRVYQAPGAAPIMLLVAYGASQSGNMQLHRPEACYPAAGFELQEARRETLNLAGREVPARVMSAVAPDRTEQVLYWTRIGSEFPLGAMAQRLAVMQENVRGRVPDGVLVRASAIDDQPDRALASLVNFLDTLLASASADARALLVGN